MKVCDLIDELDKLDPEAIVSVELGYGCYDQEFVPIGSIINLGGVVELRSY